jgi:hypothetical protein
MRLASDLVPVVRLLTGWWAEPIRSGDPDEQAHPVVNRMPKGRRSLSKQPLPGLGLDPYPILNLKTFTSVEREADNKTRASRGLNPHVTAVVENSLAGEREP